MTRDDIIRLAREAGGADITVNGFTSWVGTQSPEFLERFAALVAAAEREECAKVCETGVDYPHPTVEGVILKNFGGSTLLAAAIRKRGEVKP